uniref:AMP-dependent synthetase/ligase domain-containing protein n=1 Tax=Meloidogyne hapla TaxID=6305 RepID=A0A1I8B4H9_MELHA
MYVLMEHSGRLHSPPPDRRHHHHPKAVLRGRAAIHWHQSPPPLEQQQQKSLKNVKCQSLDNEIKEIKEENEYTNNDEDEDISKFKEFVSKIAGGSKKHQQQHLSNESIRKLSTTSKQPIKHQQNPNIFKKHSIAGINTQETFASSSNINDYSQLPPPIRYRCRPPLLTEKQPYQWKENNFINNSNQNILMSQLKQNQSFIPRSPQLLNRQVILHGNSKVGPIDDVYEELKQMKKDGKVKQQEELKQNKDLKVEKKMKHLELKQEKNMKQKQDKGLNQSENQEKDVKQNMKQNEAKHDDEQNVKMKQNKKHLKDLKQMKQEEELKQTLKQDVETKQDINVKQGVEIIQNPKQEKDLKHEKKMKQKQEMKQSIEDKDNSFSKKQKKRLIVQTGGGSLRRSLSQSRCSSSTCTTSNNQKSENFLKFMSRSKTSTNLANLNNSRESSVSSLSWLRSIRGKSPINLKTKQNNNNSSPKFVKTLKNFDAVVNVFNAIENLKFVEKSWDRNNNFFNQKFIGEESQYGRVQRELKSISERRALTLGRNRKIRVADLSGVEHMLLLMTKKLSEKQQINENDILQKPKQRELQDYYNDDDAELEVMANIVDANAPRPTGQLITPCRADFPGCTTPPPLPRSIETAPHKWANTQPKAIAAVQLDTNNSSKPSNNLTYAKLLSRATKIAYTLLNKTVVIPSTSGGSGKERVHLCLPGDRVALVYPNNEAPAFLCAFYGCLLAGVVPVPIEVPTVKRGDTAGIQQFGFLLGSCGVRVALTTERCLKGLPRSHQQNSNNTPQNNFLPSSPSSSANSTLSPTTQRDPSQSPAQNRQQQNQADLADFKCWPRLHWLVTEHLPRPAREWTLPSLIADESIAYIEYSTDRESSVRGVQVSRQSMLAHARSLCLALNYKEGQTLICVLDFKRESGLWHSCIAAIYAGMRVVFVPYSLMKINPTCWLLQATQQAAQFALVKSRDLHWSLLAVRDHSQLQLSSLERILVSDSANPWALSSCDQFCAIFSHRGLSPTAICPCAGSSEAGTVALRQPFRQQENEQNNENNDQPKWGSGRGTLSMLALSHCVVRLEPENSINSLALQDTGQVIPGGMAVVVKLNGPPRLCRSDEIGEICLHSTSTSNGFYGLKGLSQRIFSVLPLGIDDKPIGPLRYVRSGLIGFLGPNGMIFAVGAKQSLLYVSGRIHNSDDIIATVLAVEPQKFIYRGRIAVFSIRVLRDERICIVAEQRPEVNEEDAFPWMVRVLQAIDSVHNQLGIYCICLVLPNQLPKTPLGGIHVTETRQRFIDACLHPTTLLMCPQHCVLNLPRPREQPADVGPAAMFVGNIVQGARIAGAQGMELPSPITEEEQCCHLIDILKQRAKHTPDHVLYSLLNSRGIETESLTCAQLLKRAERVGALLLEKGSLSSGDHVAVIFPPGIDLIAAVFGCFCASLVPVCIRPPSAQNLHTSMLTIRMIVEVSKAVALLSNGYIIKLLKSRECPPNHRRRQQQPPQQQQNTNQQTSSWPIIFDIDDAPSLLSAERIEERSATTSTCYLDFVVSTTGQLSGVQMTVSAVANQCRSLKLACELYPSRNVTLCLDPCSGGLSFTLWCLSSVYSGHQSTFIPPQEMEQNPFCWLQTLTQRRTRDTFCSPNMVELCCSELAPQLSQLLEKGINLSSLRNCIIIAEERPRVALCNAFVKLFAPLGLSSRAVSTAFGCRVNPAICMQSASCPDPTTVYVDARALRNDRVTLVEKGAPHSICLMESGKLLPGVKVAIANPKTRGQCADTHLGEIWVASGHNANGFTSLSGELQQTDHFNARLTTGDTKTLWARTGYLGFLRQTQAITAHGELHDALFVVGALDETLLLRGMRYHPVDIELCVCRANRQICESASFLWTNLLVIAAETTAPESDALDLIPAITSALLEEQHLIAGIVVLLDPGTIPINSRGEKQRAHLRELFMRDQLDPIYVAYNL